MNTIFTTIKFRILAINAILSLLINNLNATEVYKSKSTGMGPNIFKQYSMVRANSNDGFVYSGTTKAPSGQDVIHILKTDDNFNTIWSYYYRESVDLYLNSTKICKTNDNSGYWICVYNQMGLIYKDILNNTQWGMIGYYNQSNTPPRYDLHLMNSLVQGECDDLDRNLEFTTPISEIAHDCLNVPALEQIVFLQINRFIMSLDSDECD
jgi:hypothetical protein